MPPTFLKNFFPNFYCSPPLSAMVELDGDDIRISSRGKLAERDIVQVTLETMSDQRYFLKTYLFMVTLISCYKNFSSFGIAVTPFSFTFSQIDLLKR